MTFVARPEGVISASLGAAPTSLGAGIGSCSPLAAASATLNEHRTNMMLMVCRLMRFMVPVWYQRRAEA